MRSMGSLCDPEAECWVPEHDRRGSAQEKFFAYATILVTRSICLHWWS